MGIKGVVIIYGRGGGAVEKGGDIEFECKQLEGGQNFSAQLQRGGGKL